MSELLKHRDEDIGKDIWCVNKAEARFLCDQIYKNKEYDDDAYRFGLDENSVVIDIGSNIGLFSLYASDKTNKRGKLICIEPVPTLHEATLQNLKENQHASGRYETYQCAIGDVSGCTTASQRVIPFTYYPKYSLLSGIADTPHTLTYNEKMNIASYCLYGNEWFKALHEFVTNAFLQRIMTQCLLFVFYLILNVYFLHSKTFSCDLFSLDEILQKSSFKVDQIDLVKIDVEKAELNVLAGIGEPTWSKIQQIAIEVHDIGDRVDKVKSILADHGFQNIHITAKAPPKFYHFVMNQSADEKLAKTVSFDYAQCTELVLNICASK